MHHARLPFRPHVDPLEARLAPAVTILPFASNPNLPADSILIRGGNSPDRVQIVDHGPTLEVFSSGQPLLSPIADPAIVRVVLRGGSDRVDYQVPTPTVLVREVVISGGASRDRITFSDALADPQSPGIGLNPGSNFRIQSLHAASAGDLFQARFAAIQGSELSLQLVGSAGNDQVRVQFREAIDFNSKVTVAVALGGAGPAGNLCRIDLGTANAELGGNDTSGSSAQIDVWGGPQRDVVVLTTGYASIGRADGAATRITFAGRLGAGDDSFFFRTHSPYQLQPQASFQVTARGGPGNDRFQAIRARELTAGRIGIAANAMLAVSLAGDAGDDLLQVIFSAATATELAIGTEGLFKLRLAGDSGSDRVGARLQNDGTLSSPLGIYDVQLFGGPGGDRMGLAILDAIPLVYVGGHALLNGGGGVDAIDPALGVKGQVERKSIP